MKNFTCSYGFSKAKALPRIADVGTHVKDGIAKREFQRKHKSPKEKSGLKTLGIGARSAGTGVVENASDKTFFKLPSPANIEKPGPHFHDSSAKTLEQAVKKMAKNQLDRQDTDGQGVEIVAFLKSLTGKNPLNTSKNACKSAESPSEI